MINYRVIHIGEIVLSKGDLDRFEPVVRDGLITFASLINELNVFIRLVVLSMSTRPQDPTLLKSAYIQESVLTRVLSAKIYEGMKALDDFEKRADRNGIVLSGEILTCLGEAKKMKADWFFNFSKDLRNKVTNHYLYGAAEQGYAGVGESHRMEFIEASNLLASFYPAAEETIFLGFFERAYQVEHGKPLDADARHQWVLWNVRAGNSLHRVFQLIVIWSLKRYLPKRKFKKKHLFLEPEYSTAHGVASLPIELEKSRFKRPPPS